MELIFYSLFSFSVLKQNFEVLKFHFDFLFEGPNDYFVTKTSRELQVSPEIE